MVESTLEARGGKTVLRLVHSGCATGGDWEDELFAGTQRGWRYELRSLRHYLERHAGRDRLVAWPRAAVRGSADEAWRRLLGREGLVREGRIEGLAEGARYRAVAATGDVLEGTVVVNDPPYEFAGTLAGWNDALLSLRAHDAAGPEQKDGHAAGLFVSTWGVPRSDVEGLGERWRRLLDEIAAKES
jgi:hypothetical protein